MQDKKMRNFKRIFLIIILLSPGILFLQSMADLKISVKDTDDSSRIILESSKSLSTSVEKSGSYLMVRIRADLPYKIQRRSFNSRYIESLGWSHGAGFYILNIKTALAKFSFVSSTLKAPYRLILDIMPEGAGEREKGEIIVESSRDAYSDSNKVDIDQGIKTIVIDPGHGGLEVGAVGKFGTLEKEITLDISRKLKEIIERNLAYRVILTRDNDFDVSLENRAAKANNNRAFVFISIHANGFFRKEARGSETYFLNLNATDEEARRLAYLENNSSELNTIEGENEDDIKMILWDMAQAAYLTQSSQLAELIQNELNTLLGTLNRGVKQAPFKVLTGVACPAVLVEVAFISNPDEERRLMKSEFQNKIALAVYRGLANFLKLNLQK